MEYKTNYVISTPLGNSAHHIIPPFNCRHPPHPPTHTQGHNGLLMWFIKQLGEQHVTIPRSYIEVVQICGGSTVKDTTQSL